MKPLRRRYLNLLGLALSGLERDQRCGLCGEIFRVLSGHQVCVLGREVREDGSAVFVCPACARHHDPHLAALADLSVSAIRLIETCDVTVRWPHQSYERVTEMIDQAFKERQERDANDPTRGCDEEGRPLDPQHPWNTGRDC